MSELYRPVQIAQRQDAPRPFRWHFQRADRGPHLHGAAVVFPLLPGDGSAARGGWTAAASAAAAAGRLIRANGQLSNGFQTIMPPTASFTTTLRLTF